MTRPFRILTVCTHNRARSVAMTALLRDAAHRHRRTLHIAGVGFMPSGRHATKEITAALAERGLDVADHRSLRINQQTIAGADLILTAERAHVIRIAEDDPSVFERTFTLPEFVTLAEAVGPRGRRRLHDWIVELGAGRTPAAFLQHKAGQVADPTGKSAAAHAAAVAEIADLCERVVVLL